ncbi:XdhC family protein (plasmid) [Halorussus limi]|uniref:XdhC family protein n=1 Tax=Halorussus limi TaxID=2938695 RepID=A0A8U0HZL7_9EURY|nr:XdhC/CoxI family protein [Halorussus limi]UPV76339.1 XdhC family protein [Halorussus limi]
MNDESDAWAASALSVRESLWEVVADSAPPDDAATDDAAAAVATVTAVEGSAYRRPGAKRVLADDAAVGAITAGCLEGPVADLAERALADGPVRGTFDLTGDDAWEFGLGCNGVVDVLVEPADESFRPALERVADGERVALTTVVSGESADGSDEYPDAPVGARSLVAENGEVAAADADARPPLPDDLLAAVRERAGEFAAAGRSDTVTVETDRGTAAVFVDGLEPAPELLVFGHGADVRPVARLAREAGFRVTVATARGARADAERFSAAHDVVATRPTAVGDAVSRPADTYAVVMSHNFVDDRLALESLLDTRVPYVGLMGPRKRFDAMREEFAEAGVELSAADAERIGTPVGLDLGGGEPFQIALSVVGEVLAVSNGRAGGRLTDGEGPIHPRSAVGGDSASSPSPRDDSDSDSESP